MAGEFERLAHSNVFEMIGSISRAMKQLERVAGIELEAAYRKTVTAAGSHEEAVRISYEAVAEHFPTTFGVTGEPGELEAILAGEEEYGLGY